MERKLPMKMVTFRQRLKKQRKEKGFTQQQLADRMGVILKTVQNWEQGKAVPPFETIVELCILLDCDIDYLVGRIECTKHNAQYIHDEIGLSEQAIERMRAWRTGEDCSRMWGDDLSSIILSDKFIPLMNNLSRYIGYLKLKNDAIVRDDKESINRIEEYEMARLWYISQCFSNIVEDIRTR